MLWLVVLIGRGEGGCIVVIVIASSTTTIITHLRSTIIVFIILDNELLHELVDDEGDGAHSCDHNGSDNDQREARYGLLSACNTKIFRALRDALQCDKRVAFLPNLKFNS